MKNITMDKYGDFLDHRSGAFESMIALASKNRKDKFDNNTKCIFTTHSLGISTGRNAWVFNYSKAKLEQNIRKTIAHYNEELRKNSSPPEKPDSTLGAWTEKWKKLFERNKEIIYNDLGIREAIYKPFNKTFLYFDKSLIERTYQIPRIFPKIDENRVIMCSHGSSNFDALIANCVPVKHTISDTTQCFPLYYYDVVANSKDKLFKAENSKRMDGISDHALKTFRDKYKDTGINKEDIFYYIYALLNSKEYKDKYARDLKKELPHIFLLNSREDFYFFSNSGRKLAKLHINYENVGRPAGVKVTGEEKGDFKVSEMKISKDKSEIIYNEQIKISNIPIRAYEYTLNGNSAIFWITNRYKIMVDKNSGIKDDPNDWIEYVNDPKYILELLLSVINVSIKTMDIIDSLTIEGKV